MMTYIRFHKALEFRGVLSQRPYITRMQPYISWFTLGFLIVLTLTNGFQVFVSGGNGDQTFISNFLAAYITLPIFIILYVGHKLYLRLTTGKWLFMRKAENVDVWSGKAAADAEEELYTERQAKNFVERFWFWIA